MKNLILTSLAVIAIAGAAFAQDSTIKSAEVFSYAGVPSNGTTEVDTIVITGTPTAGSFTATVASGRTTGAIAWTSTTATLLSNIDTALEILPQIGTGGVTTAAGTLASGTGTITLTFAGKNVKTDFPALSVTGSLTAGTVTVSTTTAGADATFRAAGTGTVLIDSSTPDVYVNTSTTSFAPSWVSLSQVGGKAGLGQLVVTGSGVKIYTGASSGLQITGTSTAVSSF